MQRVEEELGDEKVLDSTQGDMEGDSTLSVSIHLGEIQLTLAQLAKLRKGHTLRLTEENLSLEGGFSCALTIGSTRLASGKLRFSGDRVVLTIAEVV
jgi:flagellar motor switch/type III secretory pathway protein FliN